MSQSSQRARRVVRRLVTRPDNQQPRVASLEERMTALETEMQESRRLHLRVAELLDVVQELLVPVATRDEAAISEAVEKFQKSL